MTEKAIQNFTTAFEDARSALPGAGGWLARRRETALEAISQAGLPHRRLEDWKYTDLRQVLDKAGFAPAPAHEGAVVLTDAPSSSAFAAIDRYIIVFV
ncbi:MAG: Fe-S cluster assembly protein SufD, partial [Parvibaculum sp.]|nr:Fe-S cluster assembly protein SufD [Parvibaculum sp.]